MKIITVILLAVFVIFSYIGVLFSPNAHDASTLIFAFIIGLVAVVIVGLLIIIKQLSDIQEIIEDKKDANDEK